MSIYESSYCKTVAQHKFGAIEGERLLARLNTEEKCNIQKNIFLDSLINISITRELDFKSFKKELAIFSTPQSRHFLRQIKMKDIENKASEISSFLSLNKANVLKLQANDFILFGLKIMDITGNDKFAKFKRLTNSKYINKKILDVYISTKDSNLISTQKNTSYVSNFGRKIIKDKLEKQQEYLSRYQVFDKDNNNFLIDENGEILTLSDLAKNGQKRLAEMYCIQKNLKEMARNQNKTFLFLTMTLPAKFKPNPLNGRCSFDKDLTVKDGVNFLNAIWRDFQKIANNIKHGKLSKLPVRFQSSKLGHIFGFWCKEPQKDGTPHAHYLLYCSEKEIELIQDIMRYSAVKLFRKYKYVYKKGVSLNVKINDGRANAETYIFKYIMKSLGENTFETLNGEKILLDKREVSDCLNHFKLHKYRRYGFFGIEKQLTIWRQFKSLELNKKLLSIALKDLESCSGINEFNELIECCKKNNFLKFSKLVKNSELLEINYREIVNEYGETLKIPKNIIFSGIKIKTKNNYLLAYNT